MARMAERIAKVEQRLASKTQAPIIIIFPEWASPDGGQMVLWSGRTPTQAEIQEALDRHDAQEVERPAARQREALGDTPAAVARTLEARALVEGARERAKPAATVWRRCGSCRTRVLALADGSMARCAQCGAGGV
jgi:hypothetical protein